MSALPRWVGRSRGRVSCVFVRTFGASPSGRCRIESYSRASSWRNGDLLLRGGDEQPVALCLMQIHYSGEPWRGIAASLLVRKLGRCPRTADKIPDNVDFAAQELLEAPADERPAMLRTSPRR